MGVSLVAHKPGDRANWEELYSRYGSGITTYVAFVEDLAPFLNAKDQTEVAAAVKALQAKGRAMNRSMVISLFRELETLGFGNFTTGRHGNESRLSWYIAPSEIVAKLEEMRVARASQDSAIVDATKALIQAPNALVEHRYWLRGDQQVTVSLPRDLTATEAERLAAFIRTLPLA